MSGNKFDIPYTCLVIMGVSGCGKSTLASAIAKELHWQFIDADDFHSKENKLKMSQGYPLSDIDREPWLAAINKKLLELKN